jgi:predicted metalloendopeptidase
VLNFSFLLLQINAWLGLVQETSNLVALMYVLGTLYRTGTHALISLAVEPDPKHATVPCLWIDQGGLSMPGE